MNHFLQARHAMFGLPEDTIHHLVRRATGQEPVRLERLLRGRDNEVHLVATDRGEEYILRVRRHGEVELQQEAWAIAQCRGRGAPVPEVLWVGSIAEDDRSVEAMVQRRAPGQPLADLQPRLEPRQLRRVYAQVGKAMSHIHAVRVEGFYRRHADGGWDFSNWEQVMNSHLQHRKAEAPALARSGFAPGEIDRILASVQRYASEFRCDQPVLCHGDLCPEHLFVTADLRLSAVIDFGEFQGGPPVTDFAVLKMCCPAVEVNWLLAGYGEPGEDADRFALRLLLHQVGMQVGYLTHNLKEGDAEGAARNAKGLRALVTELMARGEG